MSDKETRNVLESKPSDHVTAGEMEKNEECENSDKDRLADGDEKLQDEGSAVASELKAELSDQHAGNESQFCAAEGHLHVEMHYGRKIEPSEAQKENLVNDILRDTGDKTSDASRSLEHEKKIPTEVGADVQNQSQPPPPDKHELPQPNTLHTDSSVTQQGKIRSPTLEHKVIYDRMTSAGSFTDTYDVISRKEVQTLNEWESIHKGCLSEIPPIDPGALQDLERKANDVASNLDLLLGTLNASLKSMSVIGVQSVETYRTTVENVEETVDTSIKSMYNLIAKCEELNSYMGPLYSMSAQIKDIKRTLDVFESVCK